MFRKKTGSLVLILMIAISSSLPAIAVQYTDILPTNALSLDLELLTDLNIINGYPDGTFRPNQTINRAELLKIALKSVVKDEVLEEYRYQNCFDDVESNQWYTPTICWAKQSGIVSGYPGTNNFRPEQSVNAVEALKILFNSHSIEYQKVSSPWYEGLLTTSNSRYSYKPNPDHEITRGEVVKILASIIREESANVSNSSGTEPTLQPHLEKNLQTIYETRPTDEEIALIMNDFDIHYIDSEDKKWPEEFTFDQTSTELSKMVIISNLNVLRQQEFTEPLPSPFSGSEDFYEFVKKNSPRIQIDSSCSSPSGGGGNISLHIGSATWPAIASWDSTDNEACTNIEFEDFQRDYYSTLQLIIHEASHSAPNAPAHITCKAGYWGDTSLEEGGGYANAAIYLMWVYKYSKYDSPEIKQKAKELAKNLLSSVCYYPHHSDPRVQTIVDELIIEIGDTDWVY